LIFYYYADHYINFKDLITELYRIYKTRIWLSAINPASFSQHALGQPPSGIGPGAVVGPNDGKFSSTMYGDPDPYGAVPPYRIGYDTYTPNFPAIPGVSNSFPTGGAYGYHDTNPVPALAPGVTPTGTAADYNFYYDRTAITTATAPNTVPPLFEPWAAGPNNKFYNPMTNWHDHGYKPSFDAALDSGFYDRLQTGIDHAGLTHPSNTGFNTRAAPSQQPIGTRPESSGESAESRLRQMLFSNMSVEDQMSRER
jgi:hypothetical protein